MLAQSPTFANVVLLDVSGCVLQRVGLSELTRSPHLEHVDKLGLGDNDLEPDAIAELLRWRQAPRLGSLDLRKNPLGASGGAELAGGSTLGPLACRWPFGRRACIDATGDLFGSELAIVGSTTQGRVLSPNDREQVRSEREAHASFNGRTVMPARCMNLAYCESSMD